MSIILPVPRSGKTNKYRTPSCAFTNCLSNRDRCYRKGICNASRERKANIAAESTAFDHGTIKLVGCMKCNRTDTAVWRCCDCFEMFRRTIQTRNMVNIPIIKILMTIDFANLTYDEIICYCMEYPEYLSYKVCKWNMYEEINLVFKKECPCCYDFLLPSLDYLKQSNKLNHIKEPKFQKLYRSFQEITLEGYPVLNDNGTAISLDGPKIRVAIIEFPEVLTIAEEMSYSHDYLTTYNNNFTSAEYILKKGEKSVQSI
jgi:hypothetical protein